LHSKAVGRGVFCAVRVVSNTQYIIKGKWYMWWKGPVSERPLESPLVEGEWPVVVRPLLSSNRRPQFKTWKSCKEQKYCHVSGGTLDENSGF
jgi:hypothetical protein